SNDAYNFNLEE
nr:Chain E, Shugoshin 1 [Homo sapiens]7ZJS_F Chain F, Shugoshin 1 [Homo sapiens]